MPKNKIKTKKTFQTFFSHLIIKASSLNFFTKQKLIKKNKTTSTKYLTPGFTLFELIIGLFISTILTTISFAIYQQIVRSTQFVQKITTIDTKAMILKSRLEQDLLGISPLWFTQSTYEEMTKKTNEPQDTDEKSEESKTTKANLQKMKENNFFYSSNNQDGSFNLLSFITTSSMQMYGSENNPYVRVVYCLKKSSVKENSFNLYRKEIEAGEFNEQAANSSGMFYEIASLIKNISIDYGFIDNIKIKTNNENNEKDSTEEPTKIVWLKTWQVTQEKTEKATQKTIFPKCIKIKILFMQEKSNYEQEYELLFIIPIDTITSYQSFTQKNYQTEMQKKAQQPSLPTSNQNNTPSNQHQDTKGVTISIQPNQKGNAHAT